MALAELMAGDVDPNQLAQMMITELRGLVPHMPKNVDYAELATRVMERCAPFLTNWLATNFEPAELEVLLQVFQAPAMAKFLSMRLPLAQALNAYGQEIGEAWADEQESKWAAPPATSQYGKKLRVRFIN